MLLNAPIGMVLGEAAAATSQLAIIAGQVAKLQFDGTNNVKATGNWISLSTVIDGKTFQQIKTLELASTVGMNTVTDDGTHTTIQYVDQSGHDIVAVQYLDSTMSTTNVSWS